MSVSLACLNLLGAVALLLWGLRMVRTAAERAFRSNLDQHLRRLAGSRFRAFLFGGVGAATLQSSTAIVLLSAGFVSKARLTLASGLAVALGADVGTAVAAQVLSLDIQQFAPAGILIGYVFFQWSSSKRLRNLGRALIGLGLLFLALHLIVGVSSMMEGSGTVVMLFSVLGDDPTLAVLLAALLTWIAHSSLAMVLLIASLAGTGVVEGPAALFLLLGANLGAALPALSACVSEPAAGRRVPIGNLVFRMGGVLCLLGAVHWYYDALASRDFTDESIVILGHLAFNFCVAIAALPFTGAAARLLDRMLPVADALDRPRAAPRHLHRSALSQPRRALGNARREGLRLAEMVQEMLDDSEAALAPGAQPERLDAISFTENEVDALNAAIKFYVTELTREPLSHGQSRQAHSVISFATNMEHIADVVDRNIRRLAERKRKGGLEFSKEGAREIAELYDRLRDAMQIAVSAFMSDDEELAEQLIVDKRAFRKEELRASQRHLERLREGNEASIDTSAIHLDLLRDLKRIYSHLTAIAYTITERDEAPLRKQA